MDIITYAMKLARCAGTGWKRGTHWKLEATGTSTNKARRNRKHDKGS